jgi:hypothetical protein
MLVYQKYLNYYFLLKLKTIEFKSLLIALTETSFLRSLICCEKGIISSGAVNANPSFATAVIQTNSLLDKLVGILSL